MIFASNAYLKSYYHNIKINLELQLINYKSLISTNLYFYHKLALLIYVPKVFSDIKFNDK